MKIWQAMRKMKRKLKRAEEYIFMLEERLDELQEKVENREWTINYLCKNMEAISTPETVEKAMSKIKIEMLELLDYKEQMLNCNDEYSNLMVENAKITQTILKEIEQLKENKNDK